MQRPTPNAKHPRRGFFPSTCGGDSETKRQRYLLLLAFLTLTGALHGVRAESSPLPSPRPRVQVSVFNLGEVGGTTSEEAVIESLASWATATPAASARWCDVPPGCPPGGWISVVVCGFKQPVEEGQRTADVFAFLFDPGDGAVNAVAHLHYGMLYNGNAASWYWGVPIKRLCDDLEYARLQSLGKNPREMLRLQIVENDDRDADTPAALMSSGGSTLPHIDSRKGMPQIAAMAVMAAAKAGWRPRPVNEKPQLSLSVLLEYQSASLRLIDPVRTHRRWTMRNVPTADLAAQLIRDFFMAASDGFVVAVARIGKGAVLSGQGGSLCVQQGKSARLLNGVTGAETWSQGEGARPARVYTARPAGDAPPRVYQVTPELAVLDMETGEPSVLAPLAAGNAWGFDVDTEIAAVAHESSLSLFRAGEQAWTQDEAVPITCGPRLSGSLVLAGTRGGDVMARARSDGKERWRRHTAPGLRGGMALTGDKVAVWSDETETVYALDIQSGELSWQFQMGDALVAPIQAVGNRFLVAGKDNRVCLLRDTDGKVAAEAMWNDWLIDCRSLDVGGKPVIICLDIAKPLTILDAGTLAVTRTLRMPETMQPGILYLPGAPVSWCAADNADGANILENNPEYRVLDTRPAIVVVDQQGFVYMIATDKD